MFPYTASMSKSPAQDAFRDRLVFYPVAAMGALFCISVFAVTTAAVVGDPAVPLTRWLMRYGNALLLIEAGLLVATGLSAMTIDRLRTLRRLRSAAAGPQSASPAATTADATGSGGHVG